MEGRFKEAVNVVMLTKNVVQDIAQSKSKVRLEWYCIFGHNVFFF